MPNSSYGVNYVIKTINPIQEFKPYIRCEICQYINLERDKENKPGPKWYRCDRYNQWTMLDLTCKASKRKEE